MKLATFLNLTFAFLNSNLYAQNGIPVKMIEYWYQGKAELTRYELHQGRYGEIHTGNAILIFVTEDFLIDKQVKHEYGSELSQSVLKLNFIRNFTTGIYAYSLMTSIFTPVNPAHTHSLKISSSSQDWCGQTYLQLNFKKNKFEGIFRSYFQLEGDKNFTLESSLLEDELWTRIRLAPELLPVGEINLIPSAQYLRFVQEPISIKTASAKLSEIKNLELSNSPLRQYQINYKNLPRRLTLTFEANFPYPIVAWEESYGETQEATNWTTTRAVKTHTILTDYWNRHSVTDSILQTKLGLN